MAIDRCTFASRGMLIKFLIISGRKVPYGKVEGGKQSMVNSINTHLYNSMYSDAYHWKAESRQPCCRGGHAAWNICPMQSYAIQNSPAAGTNIPPANAVSRVITDLQPALRLLLNWRHDKWKWMKGVRTA